MEDSVLLVGVMTKFPAAGQRRGFGYFEMTAF